MAVVIFHASKIIVQWYSDVSYLTVSRARSGTGGYFSLGSIPIDGYPICFNGPIHSLNKKLQKITVEHYF